MSNAATLTPEQTRRNQLGLIVSASIAALLYLCLFVEMGWRQASLFLVGLAVPKLERLPLWLEARKILSILLNNIWTLWGKILFMPGEWGMGKLQRSVTT